ncbi:glycoside hydrolase family 3 C-terminal domain-containing protein [Dactylosporangium sp. NPDC049525]|uniref:glycoside hydrolase family 3 protein n=1 Tax=Dactylosporangium sp. NPDC049525 TaxID=3154730 RepID=UPI003441F0BD
MSVMASYNLINGRPATVSPDLDLLRTWTDRPLVNPAATIAAIHDALDQGLLTPADIDDTVKQDLALRFHLGEFDPDGGVTADEAANARLAREAAAESMVLLKNTGVLPLRGPTKVAVLGPLADTVHSDRYGGNAPYQVTPRQGIAERVGDVAFSEGVDRIALRQTGTGRYLTGGAGPAGAPIRVFGGAAGTAAQFDVFDWGNGVVTLRSAANGRTVGYNWFGFVNDQAQPNGWFVQQQLKLERRADGNTVIRYAGYEAAYDRALSLRTPYLVVQADGTLNLGAATAQEATPFTREVISSGVDTAVAAATGADAAVVVVGSMPFVNGREDHDRPDRNLAEGQAALVRAVKAANPNTVVVVENSYPTALNWEQANVPALLWTSHGGQETGHALADVLFGDPLHPIGPGPSYTSFRYGTLRTGASTVDQRGTVRVGVDVTNTGARAGDEVVQLYTHQRTSRVEQPVKALRGFQRVRLEPGQTKRVMFTLAGSDLRFWDVTRDRWVVEDATHDLLVGASSADIRATGQLRVRGETIPPRDLRRTTRAEHFDGNRGTTLLDEAKAGGTSVAATAAGQWVRYTDADLGRGPAAFTGRFANAGAATTVQVRLDDPVRGPLLATLAVPPTGDGYAYTTVTAALARIPGRHDVYLVFGGPVRLATFTVS